ncbi:MAG: SAM-dependent chlorinase/fluorinase [Acidobacteriota bacterium]
MRILTITTDFGNRDWYVAAMKGVVTTRLGSAPSFVDLSHDVPAGDLATGSFLLTAAAVTFPTDTVHLAVIDPGVGSARRILAAEVPLRDPGDDTIRRQLFVAPDNGLLTGVLDAARATQPAQTTTDAGLEPHSQPQSVAVDRPDLWRVAPGSTFHGRDRFAPVAAELLRGVPLDALGETVEPRRLERPAPHARGDLIEGHIVHIDHFGNLISDIPVCWLNDPVSGERRLLEIAVGGQSTDLWVDHYLQIPEGRAAALAGSLGTLELSLNGDDLARHWRIERGMRVRVRRGADAAAPTRGRHTQPGGTR